MADNFLGQSTGTTGPADIHRAITPHDTNPVDPKPRVLYCQTAGNVSLGDRLGNNLTYAVTAGQILPFRATLVRATGTTATVYGWE